MITQEVEPLGGFIGDAVAQPVFQAGMLITFLIFIIVQDWMMGCAAMAMFPIQGYIIPKLQKKVNALGKRRVQAVRRVSERISESINGIQEVHSNDASNLMRAEFAMHLGRIYDIRFEIYQRKFVIKFINNTLAQFTPFLFYLIGGYLVIEGNLSIGALIGVISAHKDMNSPWKELLAFYQQYMDARIKYEQVVEQFDPPGMLDESLQLEEPESVGPITKRCNCRSAEPDLSGRRNLNACPELEPGVQGGRTLGADRPIRRRQGRAYAALLARLLTPYWRARRNCRRRLGRLHGSPHRASLGLCRPRRISLLR